MSKTFIKMLIVSCFFACGFNSVKASELTIENLGTYFQYIVPTYALGMAINESDWQGVKQFVYSFGATELTTLGLKYTVREERPDHSDRRSFPSGHTAAAFSGATYIHKRYGIKRAVLPYGLAAFTGYSRIHEKRHYAHDVLAGAAISALFTWAFVDKKDNDTCVQVSADTHSAKVNFSTKF